MLVYRLGVKVCYGRRQTIATGRLVYIAPVLKVWRRRKGRRPSCRITTHGALSTITGPLLLRPGRLIAEFLETEGLHRYSTRNFIIMPGLGRTWDELLMALVRYRDTHGNCSVPQFYKDDPALGQWVGKQRSRLVGDPNHPSYQRLDALGFDWGSQAERNDAAWNEKFQRLICYRAQHGDCRVPKTYKDDRELGSWVSMQRVLFKKNRLPQDRKDKLDSLQFTWVLSDTPHPTMPSSKLEEKWHEKYRSLVEFKTLNGHCVIPKSYKPDGLGLWVNNQRAAHARGDLSEARKALLDKMGFVWHIPKHAQKRHFNELSQVGQCDGKRQRVIEYPPQSPIDPSFGM